MKFKDIDRFLSKVLCQKPVFYQHSSSYLELQRLPIEHIPCVEVYIFHIAPDLMWRNCVIPHVDIGHHADKRLLDVKTPTMGVLLLKMTES